MYKNVAEYAKYAEKSFSERPFCSGDAMVFSSIAYSTLPINVVKLPAKPVDFLVTECHPTLSNCAISKRFSDIVILEQKIVFSEQPHCQFSGTAIQFDGNVFIGFCGTDESVAGWLEDFDLLSNKQIPSQKYGLEFTQFVAKKYADKPIYLGGHSKGGNIAVYSAVFSSTEIKARIKEIYSFDGPGFLPEIRSLKSYKEILPKVSKMVPKMSFFGMMLNGNDPVIPCKCKGFWFLQHDHYAWYIDSDGNMTDGKKLGYLADKTRRLFHKMINCLSPEEKKLFVDIAENALRYAEVISMYNMSLRSITRLIHYLFHLKNPKEKAFAKWLKNEVLLGIFFPVR